MEIGLHKSAQMRQAPLELDRLMERYQQADPDAPHALVVALSPALLRFFRSQLASQQQADDLLQETWMRIHRVRHTYRPGEPVLPWVYAVARRVRSDGYRRERRITVHEIAMDGPAGAASAGGTARSTSRVWRAGRRVTRLAEGSLDALEGRSAGGLSLEEVA